MPRPQSLGEEIANAVSHGAGALLAIGVIPVLVMNAAAGSDPLVEVFAAAVFGASMLVLYLASTLYHALPSHGGRGAAKRVFRLLDHAAIYVLIAGTYTPFALGVFMDSWGWRMFAMVWGLGALGVLLKCSARRLHPALSLSVYLAMGWLALAAVDPLLDDLPRAGLAWLLGGGIAYTGGVVFFLLDERVRYAHFAWHLFVLAGTACHVVAVLGYA